MHKHLKALLLLELVHLVHKLDCPDKLEHADELEESEKVARIKVVFILQYCSDHRVERETPCEVRKEPRPQVHA